MKNIISTVLLSILLSGCGGTITNYTRHKIIIKSSTDPIQVSHSIETIILNNNYTQNQGSDEFRIYDHNEFDQQKIYVLTSTTNIFVDATLFKPGLYQSHDPRKTIGEITEYAEQNEIEVIIVRQMTSDESGIKPNEVHNQWVDPTVKTPVESGNEQGTAGHP